MSTTNSAIFSGTSRYSSDFQQVISRAVQIASLPIAQLQNKVTALNSQSTELNTLDSRFSSLQPAISNLDQAMKSGSLSATLSNTGVVGATVGAGATEGTYSIEVLDPGSYTTTMTSDTGPHKVTNPSTQTISNLANPNFTLRVVTVNGDGSSSTKTFAIKPAAKSLSALVDAINAYSTANVRATMVNVGSDSAPDYRLSLQSTKLGNITIQLNDGSMNLETQQVGGNSATFKVNGVLAAAVSDSRNVTITPGLTVSLLAASPTGTPTSITVTRQSQPISDALSAFVTAYNAAVDEVSTQRGETKGPLAGQSVVYSLASALQTINNSAGSGSGVSSLASLGIELDKTGKMSFNEMTFLGAEFGNSQGVAAFLGSASGTGFLKTATDTLSRVRDATSGSLGTAISAAKAQVDGTTQRIADEQTRVDRLQASLTAQMTSADAAIAGLEQKYNYMSQMFQSMMIANQQFTTGM